jgi:class 3 adenylate cyclase
MQHIKPNESFLRECRLLLEEVCCNLGRYQMAEACGIAPEKVNIDQETYLGTAGGYADIRMRAGKETWFIEVKYGYSAERSVAHLSRKYGRLTNLTPEGARLIVVYNEQDTKAESDELTEQMRAAVDRRFKLELWDEAHLRELLEERFGLKIDAINAESVYAIREAFDKSKNRIAFGDEVDGSPLQSSLLWHFGFWRLRQLRETRDLRAAEILPPGLYRGVVAVLVDLCSFSSYVRDTRDDEVIRQCLSAFYAKARYAILNTGGMLYQFVGDEVIGLYGLPDHPGDHRERALDCARSLVDIGRSVSHEWQRQIDRVQLTRGVHIGIAIGDVQMLPLQPFSRGRVGMVSEAINLGARLVGCAGQDEIVVSNSFYKDLRPESQEQFTAMEPVEAKNLGRINAWRMRVTEQVAPVDPA